MTSTSTPDAVKTNPTKTKAVKIDVTIPVTVEYGKTEKGEHTAKVLGLKDKDGEALCFKHKEKDALQAKVEKGAASALRHYYAANMPTDSAPTSDVSTGGSCGSGACSG